MCGARGSQREPRVDTDEAVRETQTRPRGRDARHKLHGRKLSERFHHVESTKGTRSEVSQTQEQDQSQAQKRGSRYHTPGDTGANRTQAPFANVLLRSTTPAFRISNILTDSATKIGLFFPFPRAFIRNYRKVSNVLTNSF